MDKNQYGSAIHPFLLRDASSARTPQQAPGRSIRQRSTTWASQASRPNGCRPSCEDGSAVLPARGDLGSVVALWAEDRSQTGSPLVSEASNSSEAQVSHRDDMVHGSECLHMPEEADRLSNKIVLGNSMIRDEGHGHEHGAVGHGPLAQDEPAPPALARSQFGGQFGSRRMGRCCCGRRASTARWIGREQVKKITINKDIHIEVKKVQDHSSRKPVRP